MRCLPVSFGTVLHYLGGGVRQIGWIIHTLTLGSAQSPPTIYSSISLQPGHLFKHIYLFHLSWPVNLSISSSLCIVMPPLIHCTVSTKMHETVILNMQGTSSLPFRFVFQALIQKCTNNGSPEFSMIYIFAEFFCNNSFPPKTPRPPKAALQPLCVIPTVYAGGAGGGDVGKVVRGTFNFTPCNRGGSYWPYTANRAGWIEQQRLKLSGSILPGLP